MLGSTIADLIATGKGGHGHRSSGRSSRSRTRGFVARWSAPSVAEWIRYRPRRPRRSGFARRPELATAFLGVAAGASRHRSIRRIAPRSSRFTSRI